MKKNIPAHCVKYINSIENAGKKLAETIKKIQTIKYDKTIPYADGTCIIDLNKKLQIHSSEDSDEEFKKNVHNLRDDKSRIIHK